MDSEYRQKKARRARGSGSIFRQKTNGPWWISYRGPDGARVQESTGSHLKGVATTLLQSRIGARLHNLPVIPRVEQYTFNAAATAVIDDFKASGKRSLAVVERRITKHLTPYFGGRKLAGITRDDVSAYVVHRQKQGILNKKAERTGDVSNGEINRELQHLKRIFNFALEGGRLGMAPRFKLLKESAPRNGFFEREQFSCLLAHLPEELRPMLTFAYLTGWRVHSEVLPLEWRNVDFNAEEVRLDAGTTKNGEGRVFPMTTALRVLLEAQHAKHEALKKSGHVVPWVWWRMVADGRGGKKEPTSITAFTKAWKAACRAAGCPGRIPHDLRRTAVRNLVRNGVSEGVAMRMTGHKTRSVFERYNIISDNDLRDAARVLDAAL